MSTAHRAPGVARRSTALVAATALLLLGACDDEADEPSGDSTVAAAPAGPTYSTTAFVMPFDVTVPEWLPSDVTTDATNFVTWDPQLGEEPAVRFLVPVEVYPPGDTDPTPPPADYLAYLLSQSEHGTTFTDTTETTVGGEPATLVTASTADALDGSLGCPAEGLEAADCYGVQPELALRIAVVDVGDTTLLVWLRHSGAPDTDDAAQEFAAFEEMLGTVTFRDEPAPSTDPTEAVTTALDGTWTKSITEDELASTPLLYDPDEVNDQNWGAFTFTLGNGEFTFSQANPRDEYSISGRFVVEDEALRLTLDNGEAFAMRYSIDGDELVLERDDSLGVSPTPYVLKPWAKTG